LGKGNRHLFPANFRKDVEIEVFLVGEILIKAAPGNTRSFDNLVDGGLTEAAGCKFLNCGIKYPFSLGLT